MTDLARLRALATTLRDDLGLKGEWRWFGNMKHGQQRNGGPYLATRAHGRQYVLGCERFGMHSGQPVFPHPVAGKPGWNLLTSASELAIYEVNPEATSKHDPSLYRHDVIGFRTPVADYLAAVDSDTVLELLDAMRAHAVDCEAEYVRALNAVLASTGEGPDVDRWRGHAEVWRQVAERARERAGDEVPEYRSRAWRDAHGVYTDAQVAEWRAQSARDVVRAVEVRA